MATVLSLLLVVLLSHAPSAFPATTTAATTGFRVAITRTHSPNSFTFKERFHRAVQRSRRRREVLKLANYSRHDVEAVFKWGDSEYLIELAVGTPMQPITAILDTGSDLIWTQCTPCIRCLPQPSPYYKPSTSSTYSVLPCSSPSCSGVGHRCNQKACQYDTSYGDNTETRGFLATETLTFGRKRVPGLTFGCGIWNNGTLSGSTGIVGLGRGTLSLPSQLHPRRFSYCLTPYNSSSTGHLFLGSKAKLGRRHRGGHVQTTPMLPSPSAVPFNTYYYLPIQGISLGRTLLPIPKTAFQIKKDGNGGMIIDSGTLLTIVDPAAFHVIVKKILSLVHLPVATSTDELLCFSWTPGLHRLPEMPDMVFHFDGADMVVPKDKYMISDPEEGLCLAIMSGEGTSILGNYMQKDMHILYDLKANSLSFADARCDQL
ncbi:hypothetical protein BHE74_00005344 [Ensete ventricosum]|nr:hypothetical protein GW17_00027396 [Ensete ventricosum]RWW85943.1 hypothetical protein BHE74_00005344 [Ensete ventricosum]RZS06516.1 hypothetical protein BHM03_00037180 [Ensete ventricosum]